MKKALVHEWFVDRSGSEKCAESFVNIWDDFDIYSLVDFLTPTLREKLIKSKQVKTSYIQKLPFAKNHFRKYLPLFPNAIEKFDFTGYDLVLSNSHAVAKGVITGENTLHICYCHTPVRYARELRTQYLETAGFNNGLKKYFANAVLNKIKKWDDKTAHRPNFYIANSNYTASKILNYYGREATVIHPPVEVNRFHSNLKRENYYFTASRLVPYKKIELIAEAFTNMPNRKLVIAGSGEMLNKVKENAGKNVEILGFVSDEEMAELMGRAKAFVWAAIEDFGIVIAEAHAAGTPVIALGTGGSKDIVIEGVNGTFFENQSVSGIISAVQKFENISECFNHSKIALDAKKFSKERFEAEIQEFIEKKFVNFRTK